MCYAKTNDKKDLMSMAKENYEKLNLLISNMTEKELNTPFDFSKDGKKVVEINGTNNSKSVGNNTELVSVAEMSVNVLLFNLMV